MLKHVSVLGLVVVGVMLASPCHAQSIDPNFVDVEFHPANSATTEAMLTGQIQATKSQAEATYSADPNVPNPPADAYYSDSHTKVFYDLQAGSAGIIALDQFDPTRNMPNGDPVGQLRGAMLYLTIHLKGGRIVLDNETMRAIQTATLQIGANLRVTQGGLNIDHSTSPYAEASSPLAADVNSNGTDPYDGQWPNPTWDDATLDLYSTGADKLAAVIDSTDPANTFVDAPIYVDLSNPTEIAMFTGNGTVDFVYTSSPYGHASYSPSQMANVWSSMVTFDLEARLVYLYADARPEPTTTARRGAGLGRMLTRRHRTKTRI